MVIPITALHAHNNQDEVPINDARELVEWCQNEVEQLYLVRDQVPRNWRSTRTQTGNYIKKTDIQDELCRQNGNLSGPQRRYAIFQPDAY